MIGIDTVDIDRIKKAVCNAFYDRIFTEKEKLSLESKHYAPQSVAGMFAVKEAVSKALGTGIAAGVGWKNIEISYTEAGAPVVTLTGKAAELLTVMGSGVLVSVTHTDTNATAVALIR